MVQFLVDMGQNASLPKPGRRKSLKSFSRKSHNANLSHTFILHDSDDKVELLNINLATEEELMTLPGVNRDVAKSIVEHRKAIGRFRKIEDLALVRGIGADKLEALRPEICVNHRRNHSSCTSSRAQSYDSLKSADSRLTIKNQQRLVNINKASVFELQCVNGLTQEIAAAIVHYREKKGPFKKVEDLLKVKSIDKIRLDNVRRCLTAATSADDDFSVLSETESASSRPGILTNGFHSTIFTNGTRRMNGGPVRLPGKNGLPASSLGDIFDLLSAYSPRPILDEVFDFSRKGEPALRFACWNLQDFNVEKAGNPGVREVICRTILENGFSIIAVQEVINVDGLRAICEELNQPRLRRVSEWKDKNHNWNFCMLDQEDSQLGFIYDTDGVTDIELISLTQGPEDTIRDCDVLIGSFKVGELYIQLVNLKLKKTAKIEVLHEKIKNLVCEDDLIVLFADFSNVNFTSDWLNLRGFQPALPESTNTTIATRNHSPIGGVSMPPHHHISNILYNSKIQGQVTGITGVVRKGLTHLAIPNGWNWGGPASPHCPVWMEIYYNSNVGTAL